MIETEKEQRLQEAKLTRHLSVGYKEKERKEKEDETRLHERERESRRRPEKRELGLHVISL